MKVFPIILFLSLLTYNLHSQTRTITGSGDWSNSSNWQGGNIGGAVDNDDDIVMQNNIDITIKSGESYTVATLDVSMNGSITVDAGGILLVTGNVIVDKDFTINVGGDFTIQGNMVVAKSLTLNVYDGGSFTVEGDIDMAKDASLDLQGDMDVGGSLTSAKDAVINVGDSGSLNVTEDLNLGAGSTISGNGPVTAGNCTGAACEDEQINSTLPITLGDFNLTLQKNTVVLTWTTLTEINFEYFEIQRAGADGEFETLTTMNGNGTTYQPITYTWTDEAPLSGINYYRLISNDFDGYREVFEARVIEFNPKSARDDWKIYPSVISAHDDLNISGLETPAAIAVYSTDGHVVNHRHENGRITFLDNLSSGVYIIRVSNNGITSTRRLIVR